MKELDDYLHQQIESYSMKGDFFAEKGNFTQALQEYQKALDLIPVPQSDWEATTWVLAAMGDASFLLKEFKEAYEYFKAAMHCPGAIGNPFLHLRLGQCQFELGNLERAADELTRAYAIEGEEIFSQEDGKYFKFLKSRIKTN